MGAYAGLAVPLAGGYTQTTSAGTTTWFTDDYGYTTVTLAQTSAYMTAMVPGGVEGIRCRLNVTGATSGSSGAAFWVDHQSGACTGQLYAAEFWVKGAADADVGSGLLGIIHLVNYLSDGYTGVAGGAGAYIWIHEISTPIGNLFGLSGFTVDETGGIFHAATNTTIDHALKVNIESTTYYIGLYDALCT